VADGDRLWISGHTGRTAASAAAAGVVGRDLSIDEARDSARLAAANLLASALSAVDADRLAGLIFLRGYVRASDEFADHPSVIDAASEVLEHVLVAGGHARAAIGVASLPGRACVELEAVLALSSQELFQDDR
jgi:enamine deaminase RidA (YjgF/YER057c/UK114 family)